MKKNILITGAAKRIGATCARLLHAQGCNVLLHYKSSQFEAEQLCEELNQYRPDSAKLIQADLRKIQNIEDIAQAANSSWGRALIYLSIMHRHFIQRLSKILPKPNGTTYWTVILKRHFFYLKPYRIA